MSPSRPTLRRISVARSRWSPFVAPTFVIAVGASVVASAVSTLDSSVLSVQGTHRAAPQAEVQTWEPVAIDPATRAGRTLRALTDGSFAAAVTGQDSQPSAAPVEPASDRGAGPLGDDRGDDEVDLTEPAPSTDLDPVDLPGPDADADGLSDRAEEALGTDRASADTDGDGLPDGWEARNLRNPLVAEPDRDADGDGLSDAEEFALGLSPIQKETTPGVPDGALDSDGDGVPNAVEAGEGSDPTLPQSVPVPAEVPPPDTPVSTVPDPAPAPEPVAEPAPVVDDAPPVVDPATPSPDPEPAPVDPAPDPPAASEPQAPVEPAAAEAADAGATPPTGEATGE